MPSIDVASALVEVGTFSGSNYVEIAGAVVETTTTPAAPTGVVEVAHVEMSTVTSQTTSIDIASAFVEVGIFSRPVEIAFAVVETQIDWLFWHNDLDWLRAQAFVHNGVTWVRPLVFVHNGVAWVPIGPTD
jgi:hypothetical protein